MSASANKEKKLVIFGIKSFSEVAYEYFTHDSKYEVVAFTVDRSYIEAPTKLGLPVVPFEDIEQVYPPGEHEIFAAVYSNKMNRVRRDILAKIKAKHYGLASYVSSKATIWHNAVIGDHCFILDNTIVEPFAVIGNDVFIWSGTHVGHHVRIGNHCFLSSQIVVSGHASVSDYCFIGVNCSISNFSRIGEGCWINMGACVCEDIPPASFVRSPKSEVVKLNEAALFRAMEFRAELEQRARRK